MCNTLYNVLDDTLADILYKRLYNPLDDTLSLLS